MDREIMGQVLDDLIPGDSTEIDEATLGMLFPPGEAAGVIDERTRSAATKFARDHGCRFLFEGQSSRTPRIFAPIKSNLRKALHANTQRWAKCHM